MSWYPKDAYPEGSGITSQLIENIVIEDIIKQDIRASERAELAALLTVMIAAQHEEEASTSYEYYDEDEDVEGYEDEEEYDEDEDEDEEEYDEEDEEEDDDDDEDDDYPEGSMWDDLLLLVNGMPTENDEPKPINRKRSLPRDETPCPPPRDQSTKRQRIDTSAVSNPLHAQGPATTKLSASPSLHNSQLSTRLRSLLQGIPITELHPGAQTFLLDLSWFIPGAEDMAKAAIDMGLRFSKTAKKNEYSIVFQHMLRNPLEAVMYNACQDDEAQHILFWEKVQKMTGKEIPLERIKARREARAKREAECTARWRARQAQADAAKVTYQTLKERFVKQVGESTKLPLNERVSKWLAEIVPPQKK
ncbi:hypothetical protein FSARC_3176 [Fusarium sarcochroum]|uniref:Uncharacterized protein n=1 Tax=Fusarium sarcochroum TaxID=1208366 RepID=A0A8H4U4Q7_9HYPO|nr:hypothetical protein FSARC_3176 [Fusarium sarcochroum]